METNSQEQVSAAMDTLPMAEYNAARDAQSAPAKPNAAEEQQPQKSETTAPAAQTAKVETNPKAAPGTTESEEEKEERAGGKPRKNSYAGLREQIRELKRDKEALLSRLETPKAEPAKATPAADDDPEPKLSDAKYATGDNPYERWVKDQARWEARQEVKAQTAKQQQTSQQQANQAEEQRLLSEHSKRIEALEKSGKYADFGEVLETLNDPESDIIIPQAAGRAILELDNSAEVTYYLAKNPDEAEKLNGMSAIKAVAEIGRIAEKLAREEAKAAAAPEKKDEKKDPQPPNPKPVSQAPAPITPVGGSSTKSAVEPEKMSMSEYNRWRDSQGARR
jgi:hypothetical protein